jgi:opacity protein-like surface antigen
MKKALCLSVFALLMLSAAAAFAATDVTGAWSGAAKGPNGDFQLTFNFKQDGDKLSFTVSFNGMNITHDGVVKSADEISLKSKADQGGFPDMEMTLKRSK